LIVAGEPVHVAGPSDALSLGIGMVYQHFMLVPELSVAENVVLGSRFPGVARLSRRDVEREVREVATTYGLDIDPAATAGSLPIDLQQKVEILRCLYRRARVLILDEPTAVLGPVEIERLFETLSSLRAKGSGIVIITHKVAEVMEIADRASVLRAGVLRTTIDRSEFTEARLVSAMVEGFVPDDSLGTDRAAGGDVVLHIHDLCAPSKPGELDAGRALAVDHIDMEVRAGEILGVAGVEGNGQVEFVELLAGERAASGGDITLDGRSLTRATPGERRRAGLSTVPEDRKAAGLIEDLSIADNLALAGIVDGRYSRAGFLRPAAVMRTASRLIEEYGIKPADPRARVGALSGGNQQRVVLARAIEEHPKVLVAAHPTRGLDVGATHFVHQRLLALRAAGAAVIVLSSDLDELLRLSDRICVFYRGRTDLTLQRQEYDVDRIARAMAGSE
jgi:simple sugar transport system ATP-binding protein